MILLWETNDITDMGSAVCKEVWRPADPKSMHNLWAPEIHRINDNGIFIMLLMTEIRTIIKYMY